MTNKREIIHNGESLGLPEDEIVRLYQMPNQSTNKLARQFGCSQTTISKILKKNNAKMKPIGGHRKEIDSDKVGILIKQYRITGKILASCRIAGLSHHTGRKALIESGELVVNARPKKKVAYHAVNNEITSALMAWGRVA